MVFPHQAGALVGSVMPVTMPDGQLIWFPAPSFTALYLVEAKGHLDRGKRLRKRALAQLRTAHDGKLLVTDKQAVLDCFAEMTKAVLLSYAAIEAVVNEMIESQDDAFMIKHSNAHCEEQELGKAEVVRRLSTPDKLHRVIPEINCEPSIKGTVHWEPFVRVRRMRDALVHVKEGNYSADPDNPSTYGMLLRGDADDCVLDVCALITKLDPDRLSEAARKTLKIPTVGSAAALGRCGQTCSGFYPASAPLRADVAGSLPRIWPGFSSTWSTSSMTACSARSPRRSGTLSEPLNPPRVDWLTLHVSSQAQIIRFGWASGCQLNDQVADHIGREDGERGTYRGLRHVGCCLLRATHTIGVAQCAPRRSSHLLTWLDALVRIAGPGPASNMQADPGAKSGAVVT